MFERVCVEHDRAEGSATFRLLLDERIIGEGLTAAEVHLLVGEILARVVLPGGATVLPIDRHRPRGLELALPPNRSRS
jgi:hypothetical protein